jgi:hypothetical protein
VSQGKEAGGNSGSTWQDKIWYRYAWQVCCFWHW